jgi:hypothetical protein
MTGLSFLGPNLHAQPFGDLNNAVLSAGCGLRTPHLQAAMPTVFGLKEPQVLCCDLSMNGDPRRDKIMPTKRKCHVR